MSADPFGFSCHGMLGNALPTMVFFILMSFDDLENIMEVNAAFWKNIGRF
jgi:hypothetical protein